MGNNSGAQFLEEVRHVRTKVESTLTFKNLIPMSRAVIKPYLIAHKSNPDVTRKTYHPFSQVITDNPPPPLFLRYWGSLQKHHSHSCIQIFHLHLPQTKVNTYHQHLKHSQQWRHIAILLKFSSIDTKITLQ